MLAESAPVAPAAVLFDAPVAPAAVLFDMDGTLVDSEKLWDRSLAETHERISGRPLGAAARAETVGGNLENSLRIMFREAGIVPSAEQTADARAFLLGRTTELFTEGLPWRPGAEELLIALQEAGATTALVTNTGRALTEFALDSIGREYFTTTVCGDEVAHGKPAPDPYLRAAELLGVPIGQCLAVEDSPTGAAAAETAGAVVLVVPCEVPVPAGPGRITRDSLVGLGLAEVAALFAQVRTRRRPAPQA